MIPHRTLILILSAISWVFLTGHHKPGHQPVPHHKAPAKQAPQNPALEAQPPKPPLDLSVPFKSPSDDALNGSEAPQADKVSQLDGLFDPPPKKTSRPIELKGRLIDSPDPEQEKRKSVDGASIMIDIKQ